MEKKTVDEREGKKLPADSAKAGGGAYAPHDQEAERLAEKATEKHPPGRKSGG